MSETPSTEWPPRDARAYVASAEFLQLVERLTLRVVDGAWRSDAAALVVEWTWATVSENPGWFAEAVPARGGAQRFATAAAWRGFLARALRRAAVNARRQRARQLPLERLRLLPPRVDERLNPYHHALTNEHIEQLAAAIRNLPRLQRRVVEEVLRGKARSQVAKELGVAAPTVSRAWRGAVDRLFGAIDRESSGAG